ncbi:MAG: LysR family transcriptional regulator [Pseudomonadota bacterium]
MIDLRDMQLLLALARHRHFARAAAECGISQPAFSMRIRKLEAELDVAIVKRGNRFQGFTDEGETVLHWGRKILDEAKTLQQAVQSAKGNVTGRLTIGVVPTALVMAGRLPAQLAQDYPGIKVSIRSASSIEILKGIEEDVFDAGITYSDSVSSDLLGSDPLYEERYVLVSPISLAPRLTGAATWAEAAELPLCLLEPEMLNRRILDRMFDEIGTQPHVVSETNVFTAALVQVYSGFAATIIPEVLADISAPIDGAVILPLQEPELTKKIDLVFSRRELQLPVIDALRRTLAANQP